MAIVNLLRPLQKETTVVSNNLNAYLRNVYSRPNRSPNLNFQFPFLIKKPPKNRTDNAAFEWFARVCSICFRLVAEDSATCLSRLCLLRVLLYRWRSAVRYKLGDINCLLFPFKYHVSCGPLNTQV